MPAVHAALVAAIGDCRSGIGKNKTAGSGDFKYPFRGVDDALAFMNPILAKHELAIVPHKVLEFSQSERRTVKTYGNKEVESVVYCSKLRMQYRLYHSDGSYIEGETQCENANGQDKGPNACMSVCWKYFVTLTFCIPVDGKSMQDESQEEYDYRARPRRPAGREQRRERPDPPKPQQRPAPPPPAPRSAAPEAVPAKPSPAPSQPPAPLGGKAAALRLESDDNARFSEKFPFDDFGFAGRHVTDPSVDTEVLGYYAEWLGTLKPADHAARERLKRLMGHCNAAMDRLRYLEGEAAEEALSKKLSTIGQKIDPETGEVLRPDGGGF